ncbi:MAG: ABC transporter substrate-binding protein [Actinomycetes bacterium]|jgi:NitT/TauT family transport system substrate-binding protein|nr:ABC transporter substrate-binding protein [Actinomycetes bacterium]
MKRVVQILVIAALLAAVLSVAGCVRQEAANTDDVQSTGKVPAIRVATLQTDDLLPLWVAESEGLLKDAGLDVQIQVFQSAQEQVAAVTAGEVDAMMTDMVVPVQLQAAGTAMRAVTAMQGAPAGVVAGAESGIKTVEDLAGVKTGCSSPTIIEFIYEKALREAGVPANQIETEEIKKLPVRLEMLQSGQIQAAALPWTLWQLAVSQGAVPVVGIEQDGAYTSTVLEFRDAWLQQDGADDAVGTLLECWDAAVGKINADPESYRELLAEKAQLPEALRDSYPVRTYPMSALPSREQFEEVVDWMVGRAYIPETIAYEELVYQR